MRVSFYFVVIFSLFAISLIAQNPAATPSLIGSDVGIKERLAGGEVKSIDKALNKIVLVTKDGAIEVLLGASSGFKRILPENPSPAAAVAATFAEIGEGDKLLVTGKVSDDKKSIAAKTVYLITKGDINKRNEAEKEKWRTKGIFGKVTSIDYKTQQITVTSSSLRGDTVTVLTPKDGIEYKRYAPNSAKYSEAEASSLAEVRVGDQLQALGDKSEDGKTFKADLCISGTFKQIVGKVKSIDLEKNEIQIEEIPVKKTANVITVKVTPNTQMKTFPAERARMMAMAMSGGMGMGMGGGMRPPGGGMNSGGGQVTVVRPAQGDGGSQGAGSPNGGVRRSDMTNIFDGLPNLAISEIKVGDTIGFSSSASKDITHYSAIRLVSGVEPFLSVRKGNGANSDGPSVNIPGLDGGFGTP